MPESEELMIRLKKTKQMNFVSASLLIFREGFK